MTRRNGRTTPFTQQILSNSFRFGKHLYQTAVFQPNQEKALLFIVGCQRSGTTLMARVFERDLRAKVYREFSVLSSLDQKEKLRLNPLPMVKEVIDHARAPLVISKPLVESQNALKLLDYFKGAKVVWMYRHYKAVAHSNLKMFGLGQSVKNLRPIVAQELRNWRSENVSDHMRELVLRFFSEEIDPYDGAALFWFIRNNFFFEQNLEQNPRAIMCKYEDLVSSPGEVTRRLYRFLDQPYPGDRSWSMIYTSSVKKGATISLSPEIEALCEEMWTRLNAVNAQKVAEMEAKPPKGR